MVFSRVVPFTCLSLQFLFRHFPLLREFMHICGCIYSHLDPLLQPLGCLVPCWVNGLQISGCENLHSSPLGPCLHVFFFKNLQVAGFFLLCSFRPVEWWLFGFC